MMQLIMRGDDGRETPFITMHCIEGTGISADAINVWEATIHEDGGGAAHYYHDKPAIAHNVTVRHRYGDGWPALLREILTASEVIRG